MTTNRTVCPPTPSHFGACIINDTIPLGATFDVALPLTRGGPIEVRTLDGALVMAVAGSPEGRAAFRAFVVAVLAQGGGFRLLGGNGGLDSWEEETE